MSAHLIEGGGRREGRMCLKVRLEQDYSEFVNSVALSDFLVSLAAVMKTEPTELALLSVRSGCVILIVEGPAERVISLLKADSEASRVDKAEFEALKSAYRIERIGADDGIVNPAFCTRRSNFEADLTWLHLSDLHITAEFADPKSNDVKVELERFLEDLPRRLKEDNIKPDVVFFTGDIAHGGLPEEYLAAEAFFDRLRASLVSDTQSVPIIVVPGNHDVVWNEITFDDECSLRRRLVEDDEWSTAVTEMDSYIRARQEPYLQFAAKLNNGASVSPDGYAVAQSVEVSEGPLSVGVAGLNSAWLCTRQDLSKLDGSDLPGPSLDLQFLRIGPSQIRFARDELEQSTVRVALMHHAPLSLWYCEGDRATQHQELSFFDFILRGHQHEASAVTQATNAGDDTFIELAPGALRTFPHYYQGFMAAQLSLRTGSVRTTAWTVTNPSRRWKRDANFGDYGVEIRVLPERLRRLTL